jgi:hypothetical protein
MSLKSYDKQAEIYIILDSDYLLRWLRIIKKEAESLLRQKSGSIES